MLAIPVAILAWLVIMPGAAWSDEDKVKSAASAAPPSISEQATIMDWNDTVIRKGSNGWTCLPNRPNTPGTDPMCLDRTWLKFIEAYKNKTTPETSRLGLAYMLQGDTPVSNTDPYATKPTSDKDWVEDVGPHLMILVPNKDMLANIPTDPYNGGPWIMWPNTPYAHVMVPLEHAPK